MGMVKSAKEYFTAIGNVGWIIAVVLIGDVYGIIQSYFDDFILPQWAWWSILVVIPAVGSFVTFHKLRLERDGLQNQLDEVKNAHPDMIVEQIRNIKTPIRNLVNGAILGEPVFTQVLFANNPSTTSLAVDAINVVGHVDIYAQDGQHLFYMIGRWSETKEEARGAQPVEMEQITIPPNGRGHPMDIVLKYRADRDGYGHNNESRRISPADWRDNQKLLPVGTYSVKVRLRGNNVDKEFTFALANRGEGKDVQLQEAAINPLSNHDKIRSRSQA